MTDLRVLPDRPERSALPPLSELSDEEVMDGITTWAGRIAAGQARLLELIGELDRREAWGGPGLLSCAHWLSWRLGMGLKAAHERVRVARALAALPVTRAAFAGGRLSWSQVRAITRVAVAADEQTYVDVAQHATGAQLERLVRGVRRARKTVEDASDPELAAWRMRTRVSYDPDGTLVLTVRAPAADGAVLLAALEQARADVNRERRPDAPAESSAEDSDRPPRPPRPPASLAEGLLHVAQTWLTARAANRPQAARRGRAHLVAQIDPLSGWARLRNGEFLPPSCLPAELGPDAVGPAARPLTHADLTAYDLGRRARLPSLALRELLGTLDGERCRFPGCTRHRRLHAHHVAHWADRGRTDLANLALLCPRHHSLVHQQGYRLRLHPDRRLEVAQPDGTPVPNHPTPPWQPAEDLDPERRIRPATLPPSTNGDHLDLHYVVAVLLQQAA